MSPAWPRVMDQTPSPWRLGLGLLGFKVGYWLLLLAALAKDGTLDEGWFYSVGRRWPEAGPPNFGTHLATWDAGYYLHLSQGGYAAGDRACAFYPLWPLAIRAATPLAGGDPLVAGLVLSNGASLAAWAMFYTAVGRRWGPAAAGWALALLVSFPGALFFQFPYTESLFLLGVVGLWRGLEERRWGWVWVAGLLLPLTRAIGVLALLPLAWHLTGGGAGPFRQGPNAEVRSAGQGWGWTRWLLLAAPLAGWGLYLGLMAAWTGNPFEGFAAQRHWGVHAVGNLVNVPKFVAGFFTPTAWHGFTGSVLDRLVFVGVLYALPVLWRLDRGLVVWAVWLGVIPALSGTFTSYTRYAGCAFVVFAGLGAYFAGAARGSGRWWGRWALVGVFGVLHLVLVWRHVNFQWAG
jgi:hypothetical protein